MTTKTKYTKHNKRKNARAKNNKKTTSSSPKSITVGVASPTDTLADKIRKSEEAGADCLLDFTEDGKIIALYKDPITGVWESDLETLRSIQAIMEEMNK